MKKVIWSLLAIFLAAGSQSMAEAEYYYDIDEQAVVSYDLRGEPPAPTTKVQVRAAYSERYFRTRFGSLIPAQESSLSGIKNRQDWVLFKQAKTYPEDERWVTAQTKFIFRSPQASPDWQKKNSLTRREQFEDLLYLVVPHHTDPMSFNMGELHIHLKSRNYMRTNRFHHQVQEYIGETEEQSFKVGDQVTVKDGAVYRTILALFPNGYAVLTKGLFAENYMLEPTSNIEHVRR